jgi:hypothetical protein
MLADAPRPRSRRRPTTPQQRNYEELDLRHGAEEMAQKSRPSYERAGPVLRLKSRR